MVVKIWWPKFTKLVEENFLNKSYLSSNLYFNRLKSTENSKKFISLNLSLAAGHVTAKMILFIFLKKEDTVHNSGRIFFLKSAGFFLPKLAEFFGSTRPET